MRRKNKKKLIQCAAVGLAAVIIGGTAITIHSCGSDSKKSSITQQTQSTEDQKKKSPKMFTWSDDQNKKNIDTYDIADQTTYDAKKNSNLSSELFAIPFAMSDTYVTNKRLTEVIGKKQEKAYVDNATDFVMDMFNHSFRDVLADQDGFKNTLDNYWYSSQNLCGESADSTEDETQLVQDMSDELLQWYIDNEVIMECKVSTDTCMMFQDNYRYYVRMEIALTMHGGKKASSELKKLYNLDVKEGKTAYYIVEIESIPSSPNKITGIDILTKAKAE